jgi:NAD(P)-dependent dehydrogenase (short-subunit alcohol dehydrogenase family)
VGFAFQKSEAPARQLEAAIRDRGGRAWAGQCDVGDPAAVAAFFKQVTVELGPVDILINNAGITRDTHVALLDAARWDEVMRVNLDSAYSCVRAVVRGMLLRRWGRIINVSSPSARMPLRADVRRIEGGLEVLRSLHDRRQGRAVNGVARADRPRLMQAIPATLARHTAAVAMGGQRAQGCVARGLLF